MQAIQYTAAELLSLCRYDVTPSRSVRKSIFGYRLWRPARLRKHLRHRGISQLVSVSAANRPSVTPGASVTYGCVNIRSANNKFDDIVDIFRAHSLAVLALTETWHDSDSPVLGRLRNAGYSVVDCPRPRIHDDLSANHGGVAIISSSGTSISPLSTGSTLTTLEAVACRVSTSQYQVAVVVIYRPGSQPVTSQFFDDLAALLERFAVLRIPLFVTGDFNVRLDSDTTQLRSLFDTFGLKVSLTGPTHRCGGVLDIVAATVELPVSTIDVDFSDHLLLTWPVPSDRPVTPSVTVRTRSWRQLDVGLFRSRISASVLCQPLSWPADADAVASLYNDVICQIIDDILPTRVYVRRPRTSDPWFDAECRASKRLTRRLERAYRAACRRAAGSVNSGAPAAIPASDSVAIAREAWVAQRRAYRQLRNQKCVLFWSEKFSSATKPRDMWSVVDRLLGRGHRSCDSVSADDLSRFFADKVEQIRSTTSSSTPPTFTPAPAGVSFTEFTPLSSDDVAAAVSRLPDKSSALDPIPVPVLKTVADLLVPFLTHLFNTSLTTGCFPVCFKDSFVTPVIKKPGLDECSPSSYRPISNLSVISKLLERLVARQLVHYLDLHRLLPATQSGFRRGHSTETAIIRVLSDLLDAVDRGDTAALVFLDLSAAFDCVDHDILLERMQVTLGLNNTALDWFRTYLTGRKQQVRCGGRSSQFVEMLCGVPQGSVLGPILFIIYTLDLVLLATECGLSLHQYADDSQVYGSCPSASTSGLSVDIARCVCKLADWMRSNRLQLNADKTEVMWCASARRQSQLPRSPVTLAGAVVHPVSSVRDLGVFIDSDLGAATHVRRTVSRCFAALRQLRHLRRFVTDDCFRTLVVSLVHSRLDYGNFVLVGLPVYLQRRLQSVLNAAARLVFRLRRYDHVTDSLATLHWLRLPERVEYKVALMAYRVLHGLAPQYLDQLVPVADLPGRRRLRSASTLQLHVPPCRLSTVGRRSFSVAASMLWNSLPADVQSSSSITIFRRRLKSFLFLKSFPDIV